MRRTGAAVCTFLLAASTIAARADPPAPPAPAPPAAAGALTEEEKAFFAWWDGLGYPDIGTLPFVRVWTGMWSQTGNADPVQHPHAAFLVSEAGDEFTVFQTDLRIVRRKKTGPDEKPWSRVGFERTDLAEFVRAGLEAHAKEGPEIPWFNKSDPFGAHRWAIPNQAFRIAVLARACAARGLDDLAHRMCDRALHEETRPPITQQFGDDDPRPRAPFSAIEGSIHGEASVAYEEEFGDPDRSWEDLLASAVRYAKAFAPEALEAEDGDVAILTRMVADEKARAANPPKPLEAMTEAERIAALVHDLQEVNVHTYWGLWFGGSMEEKQVQAHDRLVAMGLAAVPALIDALEDERFTRVRVCHQTGKGQYRSWCNNLRVGGLAWEILDRISGGTLAATPSGGPPTSGEPTRRKAALRWYETVRARGEAVVLAEQAASGGRHSRDAAERLAKIDPVAAVRAIETGVRATREDWIQRNLISLLHGIEGEEATAALLRILDAISGSEAGVETAQALWARGRREGLDDMIRAWGETRGDVSHGSRGHGARDRLIEALAATLHPDAIAALASRLSERSVGERLDVATEFYPGGTVWGPQPKEPPVLTREVDDAIEALLAGLLEDGERVKGLHMGFDAVGVEPIVGEVALHVLSKRYPSRWSFDPNGKPQAREAARLAAANVWRAKRGLPPLPPPKRRPAPTPIPLADLREDAEKVLSGSDPAAKSKALAAIEARGLPAVPALAEALANASPDAKGRADLEALARRLSFTVTEVTLPAEAAPASKEFREALSAARGRSLDAVLWIDLWKAFLSKDPTPGTTFRLRAVREAPESGVLLEASVVEDPSARREHPGTSFEYPHVRVGSKSTNGGSGWLPVEVALRPDGFGYGMARLAEAIGGSALDDLFEAEGEISVQK